jgi:hypothetical protein
LAQLTVDGCIVAAYPRVPVDEFVGVELPRLTFRESLTDCYLVDPASSHMLVSKIKPCIVSVLALTRRNREWLIKSVMVH